MNCIHGIPAGKKCPDCMGYRAHDTGRVCPKCKGTEVVIRTWPDGMWDKTAMAMCPCPWAGRVYEMIEVEVNENGRVVLKGESDDD